MTEYEIFLHPDRNGRIWWLLEDALKLGAGFRPAPVSTGNGRRLVAMSQDTRVNERILLGAIHKEIGTVSPPQTLTRPDGVFVAADDFLSWLAQFILETDTAIAFPATLARSVERKEAEQAGHAPYRSLLALLDGHFDSSVGALPNDIRESVVKEMFPFAWDDCTPEQRRSLAGQHDVKRDPARAGEHEFWWRHVVRKQAIEKQIGDWEKMAATSIAEESEKQRQLDELGLELQALSKKAARVRDLLGCGETLDTTEDALTGPNFIAYPQAFQILHERHGATPEELAMWIWLGAKSGGLNAFLCANEMNDPPRFHFGYTDDFDYIAPMMSCWFRRHDIEEFPAADRYIKSTELLKKWSSHPGVTAVDAFIRAKIAEGRLSDLHPISGLTQWTYLGSTAWPGTEAAIFSLSDVEGIEVTDLAPTQIDGKALGVNCSPVPAWQIMQAFAVKRNEDENASWWNTRMRDAERYGLIEYRAALGRRGVADSSLWYPDLVAGWIVDKKHMGGNTVARLLREHFPECVDAADRLAEEQ